MERFFIILFALILLGAFVIAVLEGIFKAVFTFLCGLFAGSGIYGIIIVAGIIIFIVLIVDIVKN